MENLKAYLAEQVVSEEKIVRTPSRQLEHHLCSMLMHHQVTYRALSRAMKINVNAAKQ